MLSSPQTIAFLILTALVLILLVWVFILNQKIYRLLARDLGGDIPETLENLGKKVVEYDAFVKDITTYLRTAEKRLHRSTQALGLIRFSAFKEMKEGGQSFALAFLNEEGNGVVISSIYARERVSIYAKPLAAFVSSIELTPEETSAINEARKKLPVVLT
jgi:hypothetical protein